MNRCPSKGLFIFESLETLQTCRRQTRESGSRPSTEQCGPQDLPIRQRSRLSDDNAPDWFLPPAGGYPPAELICRHELESHGNAQHAVVIGEYLVEARAWKVHAPSVSD